MFKYADIVTYMKDLVKKTFFTQLKIVMRFVFVQMVFFYT